MTCDELVEVQERVRFMPLKNAGDGDRLGTIMSEAHAEQLPSVPRELVEKREAKGLPRMQREITHVGEGVSQTALPLFDTLDKTYVLRWQGADMVNQEPKWSRGARIPVNRSLRETPVVLATGRAILSTKYVSAIYIDVPIIAA
jgi:hypothetical protein